LPPARHFFLEKNTCGHRPNTRGWAKSARPDTGIDGAAAGTRVGAAEISAAGAVVVVTAAVVELAEAVVVGRAAIVRAAAVVFVRAAAVVCRAVIVGAAIVGAMDGDDRRGGRAREVGRNFVCGGVVVVAVVTSSRAKACAPRRAWWSAWF
jgi:hypothetical protein